MRNLTDGKKRCENNENKTHNMNKLHHELTHRNITSTPPQTKTIKRILRLRMMMKKRVTLWVHT